jgi:prephenate dehydrogenase
MAELQIRHATIIGAGLLGGSIGLALRERFAGIEIAGIGRRASSLRAARRVGAIDTAHVNRYDIVARSDLVVIATPVGAYENILRATKPHLKTGSLVTDAGSTKSQVVRIAGRVLGQAGPFVGSHPMAGGEQKGPAHARADLLAGATCVITPTANTPTDLLRRTEKLWRQLGMKTVIMSPASHDRAVARVSHLPHILASALVEVPRDEDFAVASTGLRDMTRLAGGDAEMWRDILATNGKPILSAMRTMRKKLDRIEQLIEQGDSQAIYRALTRAKSRRDEQLE